MAKSYYNGEIVEYTWGEFFTDLRAQHEILFKYDETKIIILFVINNDKKKVIALKEITGNHTEKRECRSKWEIIRHKFSNSKTLFEMWKDVEVVDVA